MDDIQDFFNLLNQMRDEEEYINSQINNFKGAYGEGETVRYLSSSNLPGYFKILSNVILSTENMSSEIDILVIHETGFYVIESKNVGGYIFGSEEQKKWTICFNGNKKYQIYNPIIQNRGHCKTLQKHTGMNENNMYSYIVFSERCTLKNVPSDTTLYRIMKRDNLIYKISEDFISKKKVLGINDIDVIYSNLGKYAGNNKEQHIKDVKKFKEGYQCPLCNGRLIVKSGKYGSFWGCSNYPVCKFTRNITPNDF